MTQTTFASNATPSLPLLDQNFTQLYYLRELISDPSYVAAVPKITIAAGGVGVGTASPAAGFHSRVDAAAATSYPLMIDNGGASGVTVAAMAFANAGAMKAYVSAAVFGNNFLAFSATGAAEHGRFDASGNFLIGTTSTSPNPGVAITPTGTVQVGNSAASSGWVFANFTRSTTAIGSITQNGTTAVLYNTTSDERLKKNIADAPEAGDIIDSIKVRSFDWKEADNEHVTHGFIAQELVIVAPQAVKVGDSGAEVEDAWAVDPSKLVPLLIKGWQSQQREIADLKARLAAAGL